MRLSFKRYPPSPQLGSAILSRPVRIRSGNWSLRRTVRHQIPHHQPHPLCHRIPHLLLHFIPKKPLWCKMIKNRVFNGVCDEANAYKCKSPQYFLCTLANFFWFGLHDNFLSGL